MKNLLEENENLKKLNIELQENLSEKNMELTEVQENLNRTFSYRFRNSFRKIFGGKNE